MNTLTVRMPYIGKHLSVNDYKIPRTRKTRPDVELWMTALGNKVKAHKDLEYVGMQPVVVKLTGYFVDHRYPDLHNLHKVIADALAPALGINDKYLSFIDVDCFTGFARPELEMDIVCKEDPS